MPTARLVDVATSALAALRPATLEHGTSSCGFAVNRRNNKEAEVAARAAAGTLDRAELCGPVDHGVELLVVRPVVAAGGAAAWWGMRAGPSRPASPRSPPVRHRRACRF